MEYGEKNFRLTRCSHCGQVADKYIECELLLVLLDVFLHRKPAFRHLMFNRYHPVVATVSKPTLLFASRASPHTSELIIAFLSRN